MGKGTKKKTVWRTLSFEDGHTNTNTKKFNESNDLTDGK